MKIIDRYRLSPLVASLMAAAAAHAQQAPAPADAPAKTPEAKESVVVTGFRASLDSALNAKREDNGIVDVVKAEDIAKFPDTNLAEVVAANSRRGDRPRRRRRPQHHRARPRACDFTRVRINGIEALATTGGTDSSGGNNRSRAFDFNIFASDLFNQIMVRKSSEADVDEGSLGATIDLQTLTSIRHQGIRTPPLHARGPLQRPREEDRSARRVPRQQHLHRPQGRRVALSGAYSKRFLYEEGFSTVRWDNGPSSGGWCAPQGVTPANPDGTPPPPRAARRRRACNACRIRPGNLAAYNSRERSQQLRSQPAALRAPHARPGAHRP
jgi:iron complex outermembrane receptor protein